MKKFEYKRECVGAQQFEILMNEFGDEGWELVVYSGGYAFLKREIPLINKKEVKNNYYKNHMITRIRNVYILFS